MRCNKLFVFTISFVLLSVNMASADVYYWNLIDLSGGGSQTQVTEYAFTGGDISSASGFHTEDPKDDDYTINVNLNDDVYTVGQIRSLVGSDFRIGLAVREGDGSAIKLEELEVKVRESGGSGISDTFKLSSSDEDSYFSNLDSGDLGILSDVEFYSSDLASLFRSYSDDMEVEFKAKWKQNYKDDVNDQGDEVFFLASNGMHAVPEPGTILIWSVLGIGAVGFYFIRKRAHGRRLA